MMDGLQKLVLRDFLKNFNIEDLMPRVREQTTKKAERELQENPPAGVYHLNREGVIYYLHEKRTKSNKPSYFFSKKREGASTASIPDGYEIYENPYGQVYLRKKQVEIIKAEEVYLVHDALRHHHKSARALVDIKKKDIIVYEREAGRNTAVFRFTLVDEKARAFCAYRWCFKGSIDDWFPVSGFGALSQVLDRCIPHLGNESFFDLF